MTARVILATHDRIRFDTVEVRERVEVAVRGSFLRDGEAESPGRESEQSREHLE